MVKSSSGKEGLRSFRTVEVSKHGGCKTKFKSDSRYLNKNPVQAAQKAFNEACRIKNIRGRCSLIVTVEDTTRGARTEGKLYSYKINRIKDPVVIFEGTPNEYVAEYRSHSKSVDVPVACLKPGQTRGRMKKRTAKKSKARKASNLRPKRSNKN